MREAIASRAATFISVLTALLDVGAELAWPVEDANAAGRRPEKSLEGAGPPPASGAAAIVDLQHVNSQRPGGEDSSVRFGAHGQLHAPARWEGGGAHTSDRDFFVAAALPD